MNKTRALVLGITSALLIACGVLFGVMLHLFAVKIVKGLAYEIPDDYEVLRTLDHPFWAASLVYVIPGLLCFIAAFVQEKCLYITSSVVCIFCLAGMGLCIFIFGYTIAIIVIGFFNENDNCSDYTGQCVCRDVRTPFSECETMEDILNMAMIISASIILAWIFLFAAFIISTFYACKSKVTPGVVYTPAQQPMIAH